MALTKVSTNGVKDDAITKTKIPANQIEASELADNAVDTNAIADQAVALSKLPHGTSSNDGKFLRANNGADPSFETITGTTINNNADNRLITGSGTANTLEGEANCTFNGSQLDVTGTVRSNAFIGRNNISAPTADVSLYRAADNTLALGTASTERMRINADGIVGINNNGTSFGQLCVGVPSQSGGAALQVHNSSSGSGDGGTTNIVLRSVNSGANNWAHAEYRAHSHKFLHQTTTKVTINTNGLCFNTDTAAANALDDYEEGTWTPVLNASSYSLSQDMFYTKIGRVVFVSGALEFTSITGGSGTIEITGLPFSNINSNDAFTTISAHAYESLNVGNTSYQFQTLRIQKGSATLRIIIPTGNAGVRTFGNYSHVGNSKFAFRVAGYYITG